MLVSALLLGCKDATPTAQHDLNVLSERLAEKTREQLVFVEGGDFVMGDFGAIGEDGVWRPYFPPTIKEDQAHNVTLTSYSLSQQKTTWADFDTYLLANELPLFERGLNKTWERSAFNEDPDSRFYSENPAQVTWQEAKDYCQWLGSEMGLPLDLPTSAQWEFAGRNRGSQAWVFSTHHGRELDRDLKWHVYETGEFVPVGSRLPPNPLGIYDMADNGKEWVNDWFSETWYQENPKITDPKGPVEGTERVLRNLDFSFSRIGMPASLPSALNEQWDSIPEYTFRCALQSSDPIEKISR